MDFGMGLYQEQTQKLIMTTQMKQALELLQCTSEELDEVLAEEVLNNPLTELKQSLSEQMVPWNRRDASTSRLRRAGDRFSPPLSLEQIVQARSRL